MASISLFGSMNDAQSTTLTNASTQTKSQDTTTTATKTSSQDDTVKLSEAGQAKLLYNQGKSVSLIASTLGTTSKEIDNDLGITLEKAIEKTLESTSKA
ncbi:MAG: hypothetical protein P4K94_03575 [Terracidiphilus sp.]|nr:hypothetical protein [Terracidiphilus sp.]